MIDENPTQLELIWRAFHKAVLHAEDIADAIPKDASGDEENAVMLAAYAKPDRLAELIVSLPAVAVADRLVKSRAEAWIEGHYWPRENVVSPARGIHESRLPSDGSI